MKTLLDIFALNVQVLQVAVFIWGVFELKAVRREFSDHMRYFHRRLDDDKDNGKN